MIILVGITHDSAIDITHSCDARTPVRISDEYRFAGGTIRLVFFTRNAPAWGFIDSAVCNIAADHGIPAIQVQRVRNAPKKAAKPLKKQLRLFD